MANLNKYESFILKHLDDKNVKVSSELCELLEDSFKIKNNNARKIIQRTTQKGVIKSSTPLTFGKGQYAVNLNFSPVKTFSQSDEVILYSHSLAIDTLSFTTTAYNVKNLLSDL